MPDTTLNPDSFMASQGPQTSAPPSSPAALNPDSFMKAQTPTPAPNFAMPDVRNAPPAPIAPAIAPTAPPAPLAPHPDQVTFASRAGQAANMAWQIANANAIKNLGGKNGMSATELWEDQANRAKSLIEDALGENWEATRERFPGAKVGEFLYHASKLLPGIFDFVAATPIGALFSAAPGLPAAVKAGVGGAFGTQMALGTHEAYKRYAANPTPGNAGDLVGAAVGAVLPVFHAAGLEDHNRAVAAFNKARAEDAANQPPAPVTAPAPPVNPPVVQTPGPAPVQTPAPVGPVGPVINTPNTPGTPAPPAAVPSVSTPAPTVAGPEAETPAPKPAETVAAAPPEHGTASVEDIVPGEPETPSKVNTKAVYGKPVNIAVPGEETSYPARYAIRELSDVQPSHNGTNFEPNPRYEFQNDRDYKNNPEISSLVTDRSGPKFDPNYVASESPTAEHGGPVVDPRGNVLGGNSRSMTLARVYKSNPEGAEAYKAALRDRAGLYGLKPEDIDKFKQPVMVRELSEQPNEAGAQRAITDFNKKGAASLATAERAVADGRLMSRATIALISAKIENVGENSTLAQAIEGGNGAQIIDSLIKDGVVSQQERGALVDDRDLLTGEAKDRIAKMLVGRMFETPAQYQATPPELRNKLERIAPQVLRLEGRHGWNITPAVQEGISLLADVRAHGGKSIDDFLKQPDLQGEGQEYSPEAVGIARTLNNGPVKAARAFRQFANDEELSREGAARTFFEPPNRDEAFQAAFESGAKGALARKSRLQKMRPAEVAQISYRPGKAGAPGTLYGNDQASELLSYLFRPNDEEGSMGDIAGLSISREGMEQSLARARWELYNGGRLPWERDELRQYIETAKSVLESGDRSFVYVEAQPLGEMRRTLREERFHYEQRRYAGMNGEHVDAAALMEHPGAETAREHLLDMGYPDDPDTLAAEMGAKIAAADWESLGLSEDEARSLFQRYAELLVARHGPGVLFKFRAISPILKEAFYEPGKQSPFASRRGAYKTESLGAETAGQGTSPTGRTGESSGAPDQRGPQGQGGVQPRLGGNLPREVPVARAERLSDAAKPARGPLASRRKPPSSNSDDDVYFGSGLGAFEPFFREAKKEGDRLRLERSAALAAAKVARSTPTEQHAGEKARAWFAAERDLWAIRINQAIDILDRIAARKVNEREAVGIMREFRHKPGELQQFIDGTHPFLQDEVNGGSAEGVKNLKVILPRMQEALAMMARPLSRSENTADRLYTNIADKTLKEGQKGGWLGSRWLPDEYVPHILNAKGKGEVAELPSTKGRSMGEIGKYFGFAERRSDKYPTLVHAVADGVIPKTLDPSAAFVIHGENFARARATHLLQTALVDWNMGHWGNGAPEGWVPFAQHTDEFRKLIPFLKEGSPAQLQPGQKYSPQQMYTSLLGDKLQVVPDVAEQRLYVPPFIDDALSSITDPDWTPKIWGFSKARTLQRGLKRAILGLSGYHLLTENYMAAADMGPAGMWKAFTTPRESPGFLSDERDLVASGGNTAIEGKVMDAYGSLKPGTIPTRAEVVRAYIPLSKEGLAAADAVTRFTFENVQRRFKVTSFALWRDAWMKQNPNASADDLSDAKKGIASYVNGVYGGLHWENMGISRAMTEIGRLIFLAPDWSGSNIALAKYAMDAPLSPNEIPMRSKLGGAYSKESTQARLSRAFWTKQLVAGLLATQLLSLMLSGKYSRRPFQVYHGKDKAGKDVFQNVFFRGSIGDAINLGTKIEQHSAEGYEKNGLPGAATGILLGTGVFVGTKAAPLSKFGIHALTGRDDLGRDETPAGLAADVLPIPITGTTIYRTTVGDGADKYLYSERIFSLFGPPGQHVLPSGKHTHKPAHHHTPNTGWKKALLGK